MTDILTGILWSALATGLPIAALVLAFAVARWQQARREQAEQEQWEAPAQQAERNRQFYEGQALEVRR
jgi:hypothetical protein